MCFGSCASLLDTISVISDFRGGMQISSRRETKKKKMPLPVWPLILNIHLPSDHCQRGVKLSLLCGDECGWVCALSVIRAFHLHFLLVRLEIKCKYTERGVLKHFIEPCCHLWEDFGTVC